MQLGGDERGVSEVLGAILVFGILVTALGVYQSVAVPNANEDVELKHNQEVQGDMIDLRNDIRRSASQGTGTSTTLNLGASYPPRIIATNPGSGAGSFRVEDSGQVFVRDASSPDDDVGDFWDGSDKDYETSAVVFSPNYNYFRNAPETRIEGATVYNSFEDGDPIPLSGQNVVDGREISLVTLEGDLSRSQATALSVDVDPVSVDESTVTLEADGSDDLVNVTIPTRGTESLWTEQLLSGQFDGSSASECSSITPSDGDEDDGYIKCYEWDDSGSPNLLTLTMEPGTTYELKVARVRVGSASNADRTPAYVTVSQGDGISVPGDGTREIVVEARDEYDNPIPNAELDVRLDPSENTDGEISVNGQTSGDEITGVQTNEDGELTISYTAPGDLDSSPVDVSVQTKLSGATNYVNNDPRTAPADLQVINASKIDRTEPAFNPEDGVIYKSAVFDSDPAACGGGGGGGGPACVLRVTFENTGSTDRTFTEGRYTFFVEGGQGAAPASVDGRATIQTSPPTELVLLDDTKPLNKQITIEDGTTETVEFKIEAEDNNGNLEPLDISEGDYFVISFIVDGEVRRTYFIAPGSV